MSDVQVDVGSGIWYCERDAHSFDAPLAQEMANFFISQNANNVLDVGCGSGDYVRHLRNAGIPKVFGFDGNPKTPDFCDECIVLDVISATRYVADWILCLEVGEHIPKEHETKFIEFITASAVRGVVLSWFPTEGHGIGHFNPKPNEYVKAKMAERGFKSDEEAQEKLRKAATCWWFTLSLMCFRRI